MFSHMSTHPSAKGVTQMPVMTIFCWVAQYAAVIASRIGLPNACPFWFSRDPNIALARCLLSEGKEASKALGRIFVHIAPDTPRNTAMPIDICAPQILMAVAVSLWSMLLVTDMRLDAARVLSEIPMRTWHMTNRPSAVSGVWKTNKNPVKVPNKGAAQKAGYL